MRVAGPFPTYMPYLIPDLAWWRLDDGSGLSAIDSSGNGHTGTLVNTVNWVTGQDGISGHAILTGSSSSGVDLNSTSLGDNLSPFSATAWFKGTAVFQTIIGKDNGNSIISGPGRGWGIIIDGSGTVFAGINDGAGNFNLQASPTALNDGNWHFAALVVNGRGPGQTVLYVDAVLINNSTSGTVPSFSVNVDLSIGYSTSTSPFGTTIDDCRLYSRALVQSEISALYAAGAA